MITGVEPHPIQLVLMKKEDADTDTHREKCRAEQGRVMSLRRPEAESVPQPQEESALPLTPSSRMFSLWTPCLCEVDKTIRR